MTCPRCCGPARFVGYRRKTIVCLLGTIRLRRAYYHCKACRSGSCPADRDMGLLADDLSPAAREVVATAGAVDAFGLASRLVRRMAGLHLSESTARRATEAVGADVGRRLDAGEAFGPARDWAWHRDADGKTCAYVSIDATGTPQQGKKGAKADGRMATVAMVYNPIPDDPARRARPDSARRPDWQARYVAGLSGQAALGEPLRKQAAQVGMDRAERWIALSDGGAGLEDWLRSNFGRLDAVILDFYHASEHLAELARSWHGTDTDAASEQHLAWARTLKREGGAALLEILRSLELPARPALRECLRATLVYFENQSHQMDYPEGSFRVAGW